MKDEKENTEESDYGRLLVGGAGLPHAHGLGLALGHCCVGFADLRQVGALGRPHRGCSEAEHDPCRYQRVELRIELCRDVNRVAEHGKHDRVLDGQVVYEERREEHAGQDEACVQRGQGHGTEAVDRVD